MKVLFSVSMIALSLSLSAFAGTQTIKETAVEINGVKFWFPSNITVKKGDIVKIHLVSKVPGDASKATHGFAIDAYKVQEVVDASGKDVEFKADKAGIFPIRCQLHPGHVGGQLIVLE
jgi:nitrosocyanin